MFEALNHFHLKLSPFFCTDPVPLMRGFPFHNPFHDLLRTPPPKKKTLVNILSSNVDLCYTEKRSRPVPTTRARISYNRLHTNWAGREEQRTHLHGRIGFLHTVGWKKRTDVVPWLERGSSRDFCVDRRDTTKNIQCGFGQGVSVMHRFDQIRSDTGFTLSHSGFWLGIHIYIFCTRPSVFLVPQLALHKYLHTRSRCIEMYTCTTRPHTYSTCHIITWKTCFVWFWFIVLFVPYLCSCIPIFCSTK